MISSSYAPSSPAEKSCALWVTIAEAPKFAAHSKTIEGKFINSHVLGLFPTAGPGAPDVRGEVTYRIIPR